MEAIKMFLKDEEGVTMIEYALMAGGIAIGVIATVFLVRNAINSKFNAVINELNRVN